MGIAIFFLILSIMVIVIATMVISKNKKFYKYNSNENKSAKGQKKDIKTIWEIDKLDDGILTNSRGQTSMIMEIGSIEYRLLNDDEQSVIDTTLTNVSRTLTYNMQFFSTTVKVDTNEKIFEIMENMRKQKNEKMKEYGEAIIEYLEDMMQEDDLYVRKNYIIVSSFEPREKAENNLRTFCNALKSSLNEIKIRTQILGYERVIDLFHKEINKDSTEDVVLIIKEGGLDEIIKKKEN